MKTHVPAQFYLYDYKSLFRKSVRYDCRQHHRLFDALRHHLVSPDADCS